MSLKEIWNDPVWSKVIAGSILAIAAFLLTSLTHLPPWALIPFLVAIILIWVFWPKPVKWARGYFFLGLNGLQEPNSPLKVWVSGFQLKGQNRSKTAIETISGFIKSDISGEKISLEMNIKGSPHPCDKVQAIPPNANFDLVASFMTLQNAHEGGRDPEVFLKDFGSFRAEIEINGKKQILKFTKKDCLKLINKFKEQNNSRTKNEIYLK